MIVCGLDPCTPFRPGPRSKKPAKLPVFATAITSWEHPGGLLRPEIWVGRGPADRCPQARGLPTDWMKSLCSSEAQSFDLLVAERPHTHGKAGAAACITMGVWAGWLAAQAPAARTLCMPATVWKDILIPRFGNTAKAKFCANIRQMFPDQLGHLDPRIDADQDIIDAYGLCAVASKLARSGKIDNYKKWELKI